MELTLTSNLVSCTPADSALGMTLALQSGGLDARLAKDGGRAFLTGCRGSDQGWKISSHPANTGVEGRCSLRVLCCPGQRLSHFRNVCRSHVLPAPRNLAVGQGLSGCLHSGAAPVALLTEGPWLQCLVGGEALTHGHVSLPFNSFYIETTVAFSSTASPKHAFALQPAWPEESQRWPRAPEPGQDCSLQCAPMSRFWSDYK